MERINASHPDTVYYECRPNISTEARMRFWQLANVVVYSAIREAVNVWPLEYIVARSLSKVEPPRLKRPSSPRHKATSHSREVNSPCVISSCKERRRMPASVHGSS